MSNKKANNKKVQSGKTSKVNDKKKNSNVKSTNTNKGELNKISPVQQGKGKLSEENVPEFKRKNKRTAIKKDKKYRISRSIQ